MSSALLQCRICSSLRLSNKQFWRSYNSYSGVYGCLPRTKSKNYSAGDAAVKNRAANANIFRLVTAYRKYGYRKADVDPLGLKRQTDVEELNPSLYDISVSSRDSYDLDGLLHNYNVKQGTVGNIIEQLEKLYCGPLTAEFEHLPTLEEREWFAAEYEKIAQSQLSSEEKIGIGQLMLKSQAFDHFLASKFTTVKRYGGEGAESAMAFYEELFKRAAYDNVQNVFIAQAHRGRLNMLTCQLGFPPVVMFRKMKGKAEFPADTKAAGDVLSHLYVSTDLKYGDKSVHVSMLPNPSHLEAANPVAIGKARARQQSLNSGHYSADASTARSGDGALSFLVHGDASFTAQGVVTECFSFAEVPHYDVGGTVHFIVNNQIGYTTDEERGRSSEKCSDLAKINGNPVIRVNADYPEEVVKACRIAMAYREKFRRDVIVDYVCFRKWGHNELDEPGFTQPLMYSAIRSRPSIPDAYAKKLVESGVCSHEQLHSELPAWSQELSSHFAQMDSYVPKAVHLQKQWTGVVAAEANISQWDTGVDLGLLKYVGNKSVTLPKDFQAHPTLLKTHVERRLQRVEEGTNLDWATGEALAIGSLLYQGFHVRISGQDVGRGTFSQRHAMFVDQSSEGMYIPLNHMTPDQTAKFEVANSVLSEEAVLGFEFGMSVESPKRLVIWEAQFGDFFNGAQIIIDTFLAGAETKWLQHSGLVMLLPHGMDGAGPEHSSCRLERFLQGCDSSETVVDGENVNMQVANPTTPAQYFHLLRRQVIRNFRKPLIVAAPKGLLRHPSAVSSLADMLPGTTFHTVLDDPLTSAGVKRVVFVSGKHYYTLDKQRETLGDKTTALVRLEQLCPFPAGELQKIVSKYSKATDFVWAQEEHRNQGPWTFVAPRFENIVGKKLRYVGRDVLGIPATGTGEIHEAEVKAIAKAVFS